jgi:DNA/RNA endonuclease YhcR with UshA esterase domain
MRRPHTPPLLKLVPLLPAALLAHGGGAADLKASRPPLSRAGSENSARLVPERPLEPPRPPLNHPWDIRSRPLGTVVTVGGAVSTPPGAFKSSTEDEGFAIQNRFGEGVYVRTNFKTRLRVGSYVTVTGRLEDSNGKLVIVPARADDIKSHGVISAPLPRSFPTREIGEATEGRLVRVEGVITKAVQPDAPYGFRFFVDDGTGEVQIFVSASTKISSAGLRAGRRVSVTGFSGQYKDTYEIEPRFAADIDFRP